MCGEMLDGEGEDEFVIFFLTNSSFFTRPPRGKEKVEPFVLFSYLLDLFC